MLRETPPYFLAGKPVEPDHDLVVTNQYTGKPATGQGSVDFPFHPGATQRGLYRYSLLWLKRDAWACAKLDTSTARWRIERMYPVMRRDGPG